MTIDCQRWDSNVEFSNALQMWANRFKNQSEVERLKVGPHFFYEGSYLVVCCAFTVRSSFAPHNLAAMHANFFLWIECLGNIFCPFAMLRDVWKCKFHYSTGNLHLI